MNKHLTHFWALTAAALLSTGLARGQAPVAYYPLNEASGTIAHDASGNGRHLTTTSSPNSGGVNPTWLPTGGPLGGAILFNATSQAGYTAQNFLWTTNSAAPYLAVTNYPFTIACWLQTSNYCPSVAETSIWNQEWVYLGDGTQSALYYALGIPQAAPGTATQEARNSTTILNNSPTTITNGAWHHLVGVYNSATSRVLYLDGIAVSTNTTSVTMVPYCNRIGIGGLTRSNPTDDVNGGLADVGFWVTSLSAAKIALIHGLGVFEQAQLNHPAIDGLLAAYTARSGTVQVGTDIWGYTNGLTGAVGSLAGSLAATNARIVLDSAGNGVQFLGVTPKPFITAFSVTPSQIVLGATVTLSWTTINVPNAQLDQGLGTVAASGTLTLTPTNTTTWTLTASNVAGVVTSTATASVNTNPIIGYFTDDLPANLGQYYAGTSVTLSWSTTNAGVQITPGVGVVPGVGTVVVNPLVTTTYVLTATNTFSTNLVARTLVVPVGLPQPPVAYYPLNESSGTTAHDASGNGRHLTTGSSPNGGGSNPTWEPTGGPVGGAILFNAPAQNNTSQAFVWTTNSTAPSLVLTNFPFSVAGWLQVPGYQSGWNQEWVFFGDDTSGTSYYALGIQAPTATASQIARCCGASQVYNNSPIMINDGLWHHVAGVYLSATNRILYLDGAAANTNTTTVAMDACNTIALGALMRLGQTDAANGGLAEVGIWTQALTPQEAALTYGLGVFEQLSLTNPAIAALEAAYHAGGGAVPIGPHTWVYTNGLSGAAGSLGGSLATMDACIVLDNFGDGVALRTGAQPFIATFAASPAQILVGGSVTLTWNVLNADSVTIDQGVGPVGTSGTLTFTPASTTTWTLTAHNAAGTTTYAVTVQVASSPIVNYFTVPANVFQYYPGDPVTLSWSVSNATSQVITPGVGAVAASGTVVVTPAVTTTYVLAAANSYSTNLTTNALTIVVVPVAPPRLVLRWGCNEGAGALLNNSQGTNWTGVFMSTNSEPTWDPGLGVFGGPALNFYPVVAGDNLAVRSVGAAVTNYPFTMLAWFNSATLGNYTLASLPSGADGMNYCGLGVNNGNPTATASYNAFGNTVDSAQALAPQSVADGLWHQLVGVFESSSDRKIYVDGLLGADALGTNVLCDVPYCFSIGDLDVISGIGPGAKVGGANVTIGDLDEVALYAGRLLSNDVAVIYGAATGLGLNTADAEALRAAFPSGATGYAYATNRLWQRVAAHWPGKAIGATGGTLAGGDAYEVMDGSGGGMQVVTSLKPTVATAPVSQTNYAGRSATFTVLAYSTAPISYQWYSSVSGALTGQTNATLTLTNLQPAQAGAYSVMVTNALGGGSSAAATLTVVTPGISHPAMFPDGHFGFVAGGIPGTACQVRASAALTGPWITLTNLTVGTNGVIVFEDLTAPPPQTQFYQTVFP